MKSPASIAFIIAVAALALSGSTAFAQGTCGTPPTNVLVASAVCNTSVRISWTNPVGVGIVNPKVWRSPTSNFNDATLIYVGGSGSPTIIFNQVPNINTNYYYWVGGDVFGCSGVLPTQTSPLPRVGPLLGGAFTLNTYPVPQVTPTCNGVRLNFQPLWDATGLTVARGSSLNASYEVIANLTNTPQSPILTYEDTTARPGNYYIYGVFIGSGCGGNSAAAVAGALSGPTGLPVVTGASVATGQTATLTARNAQGIGFTLLVPEPLSFTWKRNGTPLPNTGRFSGVNTSALQITNARLEDAGVYELQITPSCQNQPIIVLQGILSVTQSCRADFDQNGSASAADIFEFLNAWFASCP